MQEVSVPAPLSRFVRGIRLVAEAPPGTRERYRRLPDGETELLVRFGAERASAAVIGTRTRALEKTASTRAGTLLVRFRAGGAYPFFGRPMSELTDRVVPLEALWDPERRAGLDVAAGAAMVAQAIVDALVGVLARSDAYEPASTPDIRRAVRVILASPSLPRVARLASEIGLSERHLRRGFDDVVGVSPKRFLRIVRFRRALRSARQARDPDWAEIAEREGYFDQAHLIAEFREMTGLTPSAFLR